MHAEADHLDFTLDAPERGADESPTRSMPPRDEPTVESELMNFSDAPTTESPAAEDHRDARAAHLGGLETGDSCVGASAKFISSVSTVGSSRGGYHGSGLVRAAIRRVEREVQIPSSECSSGDSLVRRVSSLTFARAMIQAAALAFRVAEQIDVDAILAAFEIEIDQGAGPAPAAGVRGE